MNESPKLQRLTIRTTSGAVYEFPDYTQRLSDMVGGAMDVAQRTGTLTLTNISHACLVIPLRIIQQIEVDGEVQWASPA